MWASKSGVVGVDGCFRREFALSRSKTGAFVGKIVTSLFLGLTLVLPMVFVFLFVASCLRPIVRTKGDAARKL